MNFLGISWVHGRFQAVVTGREACAWVCPAPVVQEAQFAPALAEAVRQTGFRGHRVFIVLDHRNLLFHVQETPPAQGRLLDQLLDRLVGQNRFFEEKAAWSRVDVPAVKGKQRHLLALLPESLLLRFASACQAQRLQLAGVFPVAAALGTQLRKISGAPDEVVVLAADLGGSLQLLLGRLDGQVLFSRSVVLAGGPQAERNVQEINRTLHFAQQQFGATVSRLIVFGEATFQGLKKTDIRQGLMVEPSPVVEDEFYFARAVEELARHPLNLVSQKQHRARFVRRLAAAALVLLLAGTALTVLQVELTVAARELLATSQERQLDQQTEEQTQTIARQQEARRLAAFVALADPANHPPVPEVFTRYLGTCVPDTMRLGEVSVTQITNGWEFSLRGWVEDPSGGILPVLERFEHELESSVFQARILDGTRQRVFRGGSESGLASARAGARPAERPFFVMGVIE